MILATDSAALHAWDGRTGQPVAGFPKWAGGFSLFTPAVADLDCDGRLEVALMTREGYLHVYRRLGGTASVALAPGQPQHRHWGSDAGPGEGRCGGT